jgi:hypothetical protein
MANDGGDERRSNDETQITKERYHHTFPPLRHLAYFGGYIPLLYPRNPLSPFARGDAALGRGRKPQRRLRKIRRRHLFDQFDDTVLPFASDLLQIRVVLIEPHSRICQQ